MFILAAHILELYSSKTVAEFVEDRIFVPLNMTSSTYSHTKAACTRNLSQTWSRDGRRIPYWFADESSVNMISGAGGIISDASDMASSCHRFHALATNICLDEMDRHYAERWCGTTLS